MIGLKSEWVVLMVPSEQSIEYEVMELAITYQAIEQSMIAIT